MADKPMKILGPDHPISIDANPSRVVVTVGGKVIADTRDALTLREASYPAVQYIPRRDVDMAALTRSVPSELLGLAARHRRKLEFRAGKWIGPKNYSRTSRLKPIITSPPAAASKEELAKSFGSPRPDCSRHASASM